MNRLSHYNIKVLPLLLLVLILIPAGCGSNPPAAPESLKPSVVCTVFPQYDFVRQITGGKADNFQLTLLQSGSADLHNFQPSVSDIVKISDCDLFICVGGESDEWVEGALAEAANPDMIVLKLLDAAGEGIKEEEAAPGMEAEQEGHDEHEHDEHAGEIAYDEHVWMSLRNAESICAVITEALCELDGVNADEYNKNSTDYTEKLRALDLRYTNELRDRTVNTLVFGDRFPFRYLTDDYGIEYFAAFPGCSADTEAGFETLVFLIRKINELKLNNIMVTETSDKSIANVIKESTEARNQNILALNSIQSISAAAGETYLSIMETNLNILKSALIN